MMKTILFAAAVMTLALVSMGSSAYACGTCGCAKAKMEKKAECPCAKAGKECKCGMNKGKPCMKSKDKPCNMNKSAGKPCMKEGNKAYNSYMNKRSDIFFNE